MSDYIGTREQVDEYVGSRLVEAAYLGSRKYYDAYSEVSGSLPLTYESRTEHILKNYVLYGSASGAGVETENLIDISQIQNIGGTYQSGKYAFECDENTTYTFSSSVYMQALYVYGNSDYSSDRIAVAFSINKFSFNTGARSTVYIRFDLSNSSDDYRTANLMLVSGSTAPTTYIPYGYKIPMTVTSGVTENLYDDAETVFSGLEIKDDDGNQTTSQESHYTLNYISVEPSSAYYLAGTLSTISASWRVYFYTQNKGWIMRTSPKYNAQRTFTTPSNCYYIQIQCNVTSDTSDWVLVKGSTAPDHYIPHRYSSTYPLYIGSSALGAEEYLDYQEQKVYKRTANLYNKDAKNSANGFVNNGYLKTDGTIETSQDWTISEYINVLGNEYVYIINSNTNSDQVQSLFLYDENFERIHGIAYSGITGRYVTVISNAQYVRISVRKSKENEAVLISGSTAPSSYIPYLQPTDPPAPFPAITAYQGENTISSTETVGPVTVKGRINESTP